jgi:hypothetical protein
MSRKACPWELIPKENEINNTFNMHKDTTDQENSGRDTMEVQEVLEVMGYTGEQDTTHIPVVSIKLKTLETVQDKGRI